MNLPFLLLLAAIVYTVWSAWRRLPLLDRSLATRGGLALLLINFIVVLGVVLLPGRFKLFALLPGVLTIGSTFKLLRNARLRVKQRVAEESRFARAKRVN
jgi:hypothetical protein